MKPIDFIWKYWWQLLWFVLAVIFYAYQQALTFYYPYDNGFWSLHTGPDKFDAWHVSGVLMLGCMVMGMIQQKERTRIKLTGIAIFGLVNYLFHEMFLHKIFKPKVEK